MSARRSAKTARIATTVVLHKRREAKMTSSRLKKWSITNLLCGYFLMLCFLVLILLNRHETPALAEVSNSIKGHEAFVIEKNSTKTEKEYIYIPSPSPPTIYHDRLSGVSPRGRDPIIVRDNPHTVRDTTVSRRIIDIEAEAGTRVDYEISKNIGDNRVHTVDGGSHGRVHNFHDRAHLSTASPSTDTGVDIGLLDRRLAELKNKGKPLKESREKIGINKEDDLVDFGGLTLARDGDEVELGDLDDLNLDPTKKSYGTGKGGQLYAYNFPTQGVGAGIGSTALGAGNGAGAGLGAGIGEGLLNGEVVPTLGGVGDGAKTLYGEPSQPSGVGGLVGGAGAGGAAGLTQGYITEKLGLGTGLGQGSGSGGSGGHGGHEYDLPPDGALHIMMHVDGSGSILNTRKQLEIMKDTLLKQALLPYYNNDEALYNRRVTIVDGNGERTLQFFTAATTTPNVLALVFQDEAQPAYHLPTFNKKPQDHYSKDLQNLKAGLNRYGGLYRGVMFQVDRGGTFAKSFKEFVECAWQGSGYLKNSNLKKYYWQENKRNIEQKEGIVFSDEYHAKDSGDPQYYLELIMAAAQKVGLNLQAQGGGLRDGRYTNKNLE